MYRCSCGEEFGSEQAYAIHRVFCKAKWLVLLLALVILTLAPTVARASPVEIMVTAVVRDGANQPMADIEVDVYWFAPNVLAVARMTTDDRGEVSFPAAPGDEITVRALSDCHKATKEVNTTDDPFILVKPSCMTHLPVIRSSVEVQDATRFWGG